jgi:small-conductance mechanosensitive channel
METVTGWGAALWAAVGAALSGILGFLPNLIGAIIILLVGWAIANVLAALVDKGLDALRFDRWMAKAGVDRAIARTGLKLEPSNVVAQLVKWLVILVTLVVAADALNLPQVTTALMGIIAYIPNVIAALLIVTLGALLASFLGNLVKTTPLEASDLLGQVAYWAIMIFAVLAALTQLNIAPELVQILFTAVIGAVALAAALAFGLGLRTEAADLMAATELRRVVDRGDTVSMTAEGKTLSGTIQRIGWLSTQLATDAGVVLVPNRMFLDRMATVGGTGKAQRVTFTRMEAEPSPEAAIEETRQRPGQPPV